MTFHASFDLMSLEGGGTRGAAGAEGGGGRDRRPCHPPVESCSLSTTFDLFDTSGTINNNVCVLI